MPWAVILKRLFLRFANRDKALIDVNTHSELTAGAWLLTGPSGVGKTSFLRLISGWFDADSASGVAWEAATDFDPFGGVDLIGNDSGLLPWKSIAENIHLRAPQASSAEIEAIILQTGLEREVLGARPYELSLGMYKRVEFSASLLRNREVLLLDEFFGSLDPQSRDSCFQLLRDNRREKVTIISTHSPETLPRAEMKSIKLQKSSDGATITNLSLASVP